MVVNLRGRVINGMILAEVWVFRLELSVNASIGGKIGFAHTGYNVGGEIAGRQSGKVIDCHK